MMNNSAHKTYLMSVEEHTAKINTVLLTIKREFFYPLNELGCFYFFVDV